MFIGNADRRLLKPECISPEIERQRARSARAVGTRPAFGFISLRYSAIARVSQTLTPAWVKRGTRKEGDSSSSSARTEGSSLRLCSSSKSRPANLHRSHPRNDHEP